MSEKPPRQLSARTDDELAQHIKALRTAGLSYTEMVKWGVALLADVYAAAWEYRVVPIGETPELKSYVYEPHAKTTGPPWPTKSEEPTREEVHEVSDRVRDRRRTRLPGLELAGVRLGDGQAGDAADQGEVRPRVPSPDAAVC